MLERFRNPPREYGEVAFYWWVGEPLKKERLLWQLDQLADHHICALQINYCHSDTGGKNYGLTIDSDPGLFTGEWWELVGWFMEKCKKRGISVALSDYTISSPGQGWYMDAILQKHPEIVGKKLVYENGEVKVKPVPGSVDPMHPHLGDYVIEEFYGKFEEHFPGECGKGLDFFFSDELVFNIRGNLWNDSFSQEFAKRKGYAIEPHLLAIFEDVGDETQKIRLDYYDVIVQLCEEGYFQKIYEWNESRGMTFGCDHGGRGRDVTEFGDYFRTQRWTQGPGNDQPNLASDLIKSKVSSSISHLYQRPRTWLEGFFGSGWGTSSAALADAVFRNFALGHNLLTLHGLYYTTYGGYWEWAPPCNHFRMPYWKHMDRFLLCTKRLSYLLSSGVHVCDAAILYPVAAVEGGLDGDVSVQTAFQTAETLYRGGVDFDFMDFESVERAEVKAERLCVAGESYRAVIVPAMRTIRFKTMEKLASFAEAGGIVLLEGALPEASDRAGRGDPLLRSLVEHITARWGNPKTPEETLAAVRSAVPGDSGADRIPFHLHRRIDGCDVFFLYGAEQGIVCRLRATGEIHLFDPWTGEESPVPCLEQDAESTLLRLPLAATQAQVLVFSGTAKAQREPESPAWREETVQGDWEFELLPVLDNRYGDYEQPAYDGCVGAQARFFRFSQGERSKSIMRIEEAYFLKLGPLPRPDDEQLLTLGRIAPGVSVSIDGAAYAFQEYVFSMRYGLANDAGPQGSYHGLKGKISDDFLALGKQVITQTNSNSYYAPEEEGNFYYLYTTVTVEEETAAFPKIGSMRPDAFWLDGKPASLEKILLTRGTHTLLLRYGHAGRGCFVLDRCRQTAPQTIPLAMSWYESETVLPLTPYPENRHVPCRFAFDVPPGAFRLRFRAKGKVCRVTVSGKEETPHREGEQYTVAIPCECDNVSEVVVEILPASGAYESALDIVYVDCTKGSMEPGDWARIDALACYSGGARYTKRLCLPASRRLILDLGEVGCSAEVFVGGESAGVCMLPPYRFDLSRWAGCGEQEITVEVYNTLYNHYRTIPTQYNKQAQPSGLLGPIRLLSE